MEEDYFTIDGLNKLWTEFKRVKNNNPTQLIVGNREYESVQNWYYEYYSPNQNNKEDNDKHSNYIKNLHIAPFGLELVRVDKKSYLEIC